MTCPYTSHPRLGKRLMSLALLPYQLTQVVLLLYFLLFLPYSGSFFYTLVINFKLLGFVCYC